MYVSYRIAKGLSCYAEKMTFVNSAWVSSPEMKKYLTWLCSVVV